MGYTASGAELFLGPGGIAALIIMPPAGRMTKKNINPRLMPAAGPTISARALGLMSGFNLNEDFQAAVRPRIIRGFELGLFLWVALTFFSIKN